MCDGFEFSHISMADRYAGLYRTGDEPFNVLLDTATGKPAMFESSLQAIRAAKAYVRSLQPSPPAPEPPVGDILGVGDWRRKKASFYAEGQLIRKTGSFQPFVVERKKGKKIVRPQV